MKNEKKITAVVEKAVKILNENPELKYYEAITKAKEVLKNEYNIREFDGSNNTETSSMDI